MQISLMLLRFFDFAIDCFLRIPGLFFSHTEVLQCLSDAMTVCEAGENRAGSNARVPRAQVRSESRCRDVLTKLQIGICKQCGLISAAQIVRSGVQPSRHLRMIVEISLSPLRILTLQRRPLETYI